MQKDKIQLMASGHGVEKDKRVPLAVEPHG